MRFSNAVSISMLTVALSTPLAWGHPGHGTTEPDSPAHYLIEPQHGWWVIAAMVAGAAAVAWRRFSRNAEQRAPAVRPGRPADNE